MSNRSNLIIVQNRERQLCFSKGGELLHAALFWGPEVATQFVRSTMLLGQNDWLDENWCESAALIDHDNRKLLWFGGEDVGFDVHERRAFLPLLQKQWLDWQTDWAHGGLVEIGTYLGVNPETFLKKEVNPNYLIREWDDELSPTSLLLTVRNQQITKAAQAIGVIESLWTGSSQLSRLSAIPLTTSLAWNDYFPRMGVHLDMDSRELWWWTNSPTEAAEQRIAAAWPEWKTHWLRDHYEEHLRLAAINITLPQPPDMKELQTTAIAAMCRHVVNWARQTNIRIAGKRGRALLSPFSPAANSIAELYAARMKILDTLLNDINHHGPITTQRP